MSGVGDSAGYVVLVMDRLDNEVWNETPSGVFNTIGQAVGMVDEYEARQVGAERQDVHAVARLQLAMISRPGKNCDPALDPEGIRLVQQIHDRKNQSP